jgi:hypothetical protein
VDRAAGVPHVRFVLDVDIDRLTGEPVEELGRIPRYWAGNLKDHELIADDRQEIHDAAHQGVGSGASTEIEHVSSSLAAATSVSFRWAQPHSHQRGGRLRSPHLRLAYGRWFACADRLLRR